MSSRSVLRFAWNGRVLEARQGDSIAAALAANGVRCLGRSRTGRPRGVFCGMGACSECLVIVDGKRSERACMVELRNGMRILPQQDAEPIPIQGSSLPQRENLELECDATIVGAGPAGLSAGIALRRRGHSVQVLDERPDPGGQYFKSRSSGYRGSASLDRQHREGVALRRRAVAAGMNLNSEAAVWFARSHSTEYGDRYLLKAVQGHRALTVCSRAVIVATGALETPALVPGWTLPGAMTIGAAQTLVRRYGAAPGRRTVVASNGPLGMQLASELIGLGADVAACAERATPGSLTALMQALLADPVRTLTGVDYRLRLLRHGIRYWSGWEVSEIHGEASVEGVTLRRLADGNEQHVSADTVCIGDGFSGQIELARLLGVPLVIEPETFQPTIVHDRNGRTQVPGLWVAGDAGGLRGAQWAMEQGNRAGEDTARFLGTAEGGVSGRSSPSRTERFQKALWSLYRASPRPLTGDRLIICRCEEVTLSAVRAAIRNGAADIGAIKRSTRLGMGRCQGRYCTASALRLLADHWFEPEPERLMAPQLPVKPVRMSMVASEKPEWKGHAQTEFTGRPMPSASTPLQLSSADLAIIGAGITGIVASLRAARAGARVVCFDRGAINGEASGGNAGSLHLQLLSWEFGKRNVFADAPLHTLPLQQESIENWIAIENDLGRSLEIAQTGGMMVAEDQEQMEFLKAKAKAERRVGIDTEIIDGDEVRKLAPLVSEHIVGAALCAGEGKINPLLASGALLNEARRHGVILEEYACVEGVEPTSGGYRVRSRRGEIVARKLLIAAGGWSADIARMFDVELPVRGAPIQIVVTESVPPVAPCMFTHAGRHITMKQTDSGNILIGGAWSAEADRKGYPRVKLASLEGNLWVAERILPAAGQFTVIRSWGSMNIDIDGAPLIATLPGHPDVVVAAAANGYTLAPVLGREAAKLALTGTVRSDLTQFGLDRFD